MKPNDFPTDLQEVIREHYSAQPRGIYAELSRELGITPRGITFQLSAGSFRSMTWDFFGRLAYYRNSELASILHPASLSASNSPQPIVPELASPSSSDGDDL